MYFITCGGCFMSCSCEIYCLNCGDEVYCMSFSGEVYSIIPAAVVRVILIYKLWDKVCYMSYGGDGFCNRLW